MKQNGAMDQKEFYLTKFLRSSRLTLFSQRQPTNFSALQPAEKTEPKKIAENVAI
jgi:hypothetical protein